MRHKLHRQKNSEAVNSNIKKSPKLIVTAAVLDIFISIKVTTLLDELKAV